MFTQADFILCDAEKEHTRIVCRLLRKSGSCQNTTPPQIEHFLFLFVVKCEEILVEFTCHTSAESSAINRRDKFQPKTTCEQAVKFSEYISASAYCKYISRSTFLIFEYLILSHSFVYFCYSCLCLARSKLRLLVVPLLEPIFFFQFGVIEILF